MKTQNHLEEIVALRPKSETSTAIYDSIAAIEALARDYGSRAEVLREKREESLLSMTADELLGLDRDVAALGIAGEQAREMVARLKVKAVERKREERIEVLLTGENGRTSLVKKQNDYALRFDTVYADLVAKYLAMREEGYELIAEAASFNSQVKVCARETQTDINDFLKRVPMIETKPVSAAYFEKVCLPAPGLKVSDYFRVEMVHQGNFWTPGVEPLSQEFLRSIAKTTEKNDQRQGAGTQVEVKTSSQYSVVKG